MVIENWPSITCVTIPRSVKQTIASCWISIGEKCRAQFSTRCLVIVFGSNPDTFDGSAANFGGQSKSILMEDNQIVTEVTVYVPQISSFQLGVSYSYILVFTKQDSNIDESLSLKIPKANLKIIWMKRIQYKLTAVQTR